MGVYRSSLHDTFCGAVYCGQSILLTFASNVYSVHFEECSLYHESIVVVPGTNPVS